MTSLTIVALLIFIRNKMFISIMLITYRKPLIFRFKTDLAYALNSKSWLKVSRDSRRWRYNKPSKAIQLRLFRSALLLLTIALAETPVLAVVGVPATGSASIGAETLNSLLAAAKSNMPSDPSTAGRSAQAAEALAKKLPESQARTICVATALWLQAESLQRRNKADAAVALVDSAIKSVAVIRPAIKLQGDLLQTRAGIESSLGQPEAALEDYQGAYAIFDKISAVRSKAVVMQNIGLLYLAANDLKRVFYYYSLAKEIVPNDPMLNLSASANLAQALFFAKQYVKSEVEYKRAYEIAATTQSPILKVQMLTNIARMQIALGRHDEASVTLSKAIKLWLSNRTPEMIPLLFETRADLALEEKRSPEAVQFVEQALAFVGDAAATQPYWQLQFTAYQAYAQVGDSAKALAHLEVYNKLDNQSRALAASTSAALSAARFDFVNQNARIATLKAGQLGRDIALARLQSRQNLIVSVSLLLIAIIIVAVLMFYLRALRRSGKAIQKINAQLLEVNVELKAALAAKTEFLATTSHEIRTPLNGILGMTQVLLADRALTGVVRERISLMQGAGETLRALVDDILDFAKMSDNKLELQLLETDLPMLLDDVVDFWRDRATQQGLMLTLDRTDAPERVIIDSRRLRQILANLLSNAIKFTSEGSVKLTVKTVSRTSDKFPAQSGERLRIDVTDTGIGIAETDYAAVFEKFRQLDGSTTRRFVGTGLGLAISRMIAQAMDGDIELLSTVEVGSTFTLDLPLMRAVAAVPSTSGERPSTLAAARLLLIGANPIAQGILRAVLTPRVASFAVAADIPAAANQITAHSIDLIVIDVPAPLDVETGCDLEARIVGLAAPVNLASRAGVIVSVLWPNQQMTEHARLLAAGVAAVVGKPVTSSALLQKLTALFEEACDGVVSDSAAAPRGSSLRSNQSRLRGD